MDRGGIKMSKSKENVKNGSYVYYSRLLEKSDDFLCVYKKTHKLKGMNAKACFYFYNKREQENSDIFLKMQSIYYELLEKKLISSFGAFLKEKNLIGNKNSIYNNIQRWFVVRENQIPLHYYNKMVKIKTAFEEFKIIKGM